MPFCLCAGPPKVVGEEGVPEKPLAVTVDAPKVDANDKLATSKDDHLVTEDSWNTSTSPACPSEACTSTSQACFGQDQFFMQPLGSDLCGAEQLGWEPCSAGSLQGRHPSDYNTNPLLGNTRYKKLRDLGAGTYGFVLLAHDTKVGDMCAIKFLERGRTLGKMVEREILSHRSCSAHPHIVRFREIFLTPRYLAIAMEYAAGGDLFEYTLRHNGHINENQARHIFQQLMSAVAFCHSVGVVNRDIKLENALLLDTSPSPVLKLCDFGYSKNEQLDSACKTAAGTPEYVAPEMVLTQGNYNGKASDVWSCGIFLYVLLNGAYPFHTEPGDKLAIKRMVKGIYKFHVDVSPACMDLVSRMLIPNPSDRISVADILKHPWYLRNLSPELRSINRRMGSLVASAPQTEDEIQNIITIAQEVDPALLASFQSMGFP